MIPIHKDILLAGWIFIIASIISALSYSTVLSFETPEPVISHTLKEGNNVFNIKSRGSCIGQITTSLVHEKIYLLKTNAHIRGRYLNKVEKALIAVEAAFNPLGQMFESSSQIKGANNSITLTTSKINPISLELTATLPHQHLSHDFEASGPVIIKSIGKGSYRIEYPFSHNTSRATMSKIIEGIFKDLEIAIIPSQNSTECTNDSTSALEIEPLISKLGALRSLLSLTDGKLL